MWEITNKSENEAEILLYDKISSFHDEDWGYTNARALVKEIKALGNIKNITLRINSVGGDVFQAQTMYNYSDAAAMILKNERYLKLLDNRRVEMGEIKPSELENGVTYLGRIIVPGASFELYSYNEWYPDATDLDTDGQPKLKPLLDPETVIIQSSREKNSMLYGMITRVEKTSGNFVTYMQEYVPHTWWTENPSQKFISISSRPLPMPHDLKSWYVLKGVITGAA